MPKFMLTCCGDTGITSDRDVPLIGAITSGTTPADLQGDVRASYTLENLLVRIRGNGRNGSTSFTVRVDDVDTSLTISVPASTTGEFEDTSNPRPRGWRVWRMLLES